MATLDFESISKIKTPSEAQAATQRLRVIVSTPDAMIMTPDGTDTRTIGPRSRRSFSSSQERDAMERPTVFSLAQDLRGRALDSAYRSRVVGAAKKVSVLSNRPSSLSAVEYRWELVARPYAICALSRCEGRSRLVRMCGERDLFIRKKKAYA